MQIQGYFDLRFEAVKEAFAALFNDPQERGAALCVQIDGETVTGVTEYSVATDAAKENAARQTMAG